MEAQELVGKKVRLITKRGTTYRVEGAHSPRCGETEWLLDIINLKDGERYSVYEYEVEPI
jgi:hypothetical protein